MENLNGSCMAWRIALVLAIFFAGSSGCDPVPEPDPGQPKNDTVAWSGYNVLVSPGSSADDRQNAVNNLTEYLDAFLADYNTTHRLHIKKLQYIHYCPCDSNLVNIDAQLLGGVSTTYPPPPPPPKGGSGDNGTFIRYAMDFRIQKDSLSEFSTHGITSGKMDLRGRTVSTRHVLAVIDTGLDSGFFASRPSNWIWSEGPNTLYNTLPGAQKNDLYDDHAGKHGTGVASLVHQMSRSNKIPQLMILKALDSNKQGSTYTVSCAMSYAIQHKATAINASLGYFAPQVHSDSVMWTYISRANDAKIPVFAAAGNVRKNERIMPDQCEDRQDINNQLTDNRRFFPACYAPEFPYLISVTGLRTPTIACTNQNYSDQFIKVGLFNKSNCCSYITPFNPDGFHGSSFATPMVAGVFLAELMRSPTVRPLDVLGGMESHDARNNLTIGGTFISVHQR